MLTPPENPRRLDPTAVLEAFRAAGEETRLRILALLQSSELTVSQLCRILGQSQPRVSRHLKVLTEADLVERHREGVWTFFSLARGPGPIDAVERGLLAAQRQILERFGDQDRLAEITAERENRAQSYLRENASRWSAERALHLDEAGVESAMLGLAGKGPYRTMIDLGTGGGRMLELFSDRIGEGVGVDVSSEMLSFARNRLMGQRRLRVRMGDLFNLGELAGSGDLVVMHQVLHFLSDPQAAITAAARALAPRGRLLIADFAPHERVELIERCGHARLGFSDEEMERWFTRAGLALAGTERIAPADGGAEQIPVALWLAERIEVEKPAGKLNEARSFETAPALES